MALKSIYDEANWPNETDEAAFKAAVNLAEFTREQKSVSNPDSKQKVGIQVAMTDAEMLDRMWDVKRDADQRAADAVDPEKHPLTLFQFNVALKLLNKTKAELEAAVAGAITDPIQQAVALSAIDHPPNGMYHRDNALFSNPDILSALSLTASQIDTTWLQVKDIQSA